MKAGKTIGSGGFGCVFRPALKCKGVNERESNKISKVMTSNNALDEYNQIMLLKDKTGYSDKCKTWEAQITKT